MHPSPVTSKDLSLHSDAWQANLPESHGLRLHSMGELQGWRPAGQVLVVRPRGIDRAVCGIN
jgi:hypothetical protein